MVKTLADVFAVVAALSIVGATPLGTDGIYHVVQTVGAPVALIVYFVLRDAKREKELVAQISNLHQWYRTELVSHLEASTKALDKACEATREMSQAVKDLGKVQGEFFKRGH